MLDFLFISSPTNMTSKHMPYYFLYLAGYLKEKGFSCKIIDYKDEDVYHGTDKFWKTIGERVRQKQARFCGLACFTPDYMVIKRLGEVIKKAQPNTTLLVGNAHATVRPTDFIYPNSPFDIIVRGEGEIVCENLANGITGGREQQAERLLTGDEIATPAYELIDLDWYLRPQKDIIRRLYTRSVYVFASRGCLFSCVFCSTNVNRMSNTVRTRPARHLIKEMEFLIARGAEFFYIADDTFGIDKKWLVEWFTRKLVYLPDVPYAVQTRASNVTEKMVHDLKVTGCIQLEVGVESPVQRLLDRIKKQISLKDITSTAEQCKRHKMRLFNCFMINLPGEQSQDTAAILDFVKKSKPTASILSICTPYPGTVLHKQYIEGSDFDKPSNYWKFKDSRTDEAFRMSDHKLDLGETARYMERKMKIAPLFERMWALRPYQPLYWKTVLQSPHRKAYIKCWCLDIRNTFLKWIIKRLRLDKTVKKYLWR